ncbi:hypothetical protein [Marinicella marina]|uniref:hypothetical protein n=1 Tax=Marinicella marina TaxID=2996016 RepID=UPI0024BCF2A2|nr:hypothetical protein [Marinicella marina]MDJ1139642.1 hypothetical protein [Marinicella marina]
MSIKLNHNWSIEHHKHGGFNLIETHNKGFNKKTGKDTITSRSYYYPNLKLCVDKMLENQFNNEADSLTIVIYEMATFRDEILERLEEIADAKES